MRNIPGLNSNKNFCGKNADSGFQEVRSLPLYTPMLVCADYTKVNATSTEACVCTAFYCIAVILNVLF